jgi:drug/metabolite transporter (DMT)-like permease
VKVLLPLLYALTAAVGNALFALGQKQSAAVYNSLAFVAASAFIAVTLAFLAAPFVGAPAYTTIVREHCPSLALSGVGLFLTYVGFNLLYARYGASYYVLYAVLSIVTTTLVVGVAWLKESFNIYNQMALLCAIAAVILFSVGQASMADR